MRGTVVFLVALGLTAVATPAHSRTLSQAATTNAIWCMPVAATDAGALTTCNNAVKLADTATIKFSCVAGGDAEGCAKLVADGDATLTTQGGAAMLTAFETHKLEPFASEDYKLAGIADGASYYSVAVVNKTFCTADTTLADLKDTRSCHTGYGRTAGWTLPIGYLAGGINPVIAKVATDADVPVDAQSVAAFFSGGVCALRNADDGPTEASLCSACTSGGACDETNIYYDYDGTLRGVMEGVCDVAFTKHATVLEVAADGSAPADWATVNKADLALVCPTGGCKSVDEFLDCHISRAPAYSVMTTAAFRNSTAGKAVQAALVLAGQNQAYLDATIGLEGNFAYSADTKGIKAVTQPFLSYYGVNTKQAFDGIAALNAETPATPTPAGTPAATSATTRWCIPSDASAAVVDACTKAVAAADTATIKFSCVAGGDADSCQKMVADGDADLVVLGGSTQLPANTNLGLEPIAAEYYGLKDGVEYYSVAVVNKDFCSGTKSFKDLKGKRSCHTGYRKTAGWMMPVGILTADGTIPRVDSNDAVQADAESVASFFSTTCAPSTSDDFAEGPMLGGGKFDGLCTGCKGDCTVNDNYADYAGSLRCLMEDAGDVAFVKQSTPVEYASDGAKAEAWSSIASADMMLLCPNGGCAAIGDYESCNLAKVPARAVMSRAGMRSSTEGKAIAAALESGGTALADGIKAISADGEVLLGASTQSLKAVDIPFEEYFGASSKAAYESITELDALATAQATGAPAPSSSSSGVSSGAAAGIGIGCAVAGILIGVVAMKLLNKKRSKYAPHADTAAVNAGNGASSEWGGNGKL